MKHRLWVAALLGGVALSSAALAQPAETVAGTYAQVNLGSGLGGTAKLSVSETGLGSAAGSEDLNAGFFGSAALGRSFGNGFALEGEAVYLKNDIDTDDLNQAIGTPLSASVQAVGVMANVRYAVTAVGATTVHVGAGVGYGRAKYELLGASDDKSGAMWQVMAGLSYPISDRTSWDVGYRYLGVPDYDFSETSGGVTDKVKVESRVHILSIGMRQKF
jgi:opacity protein-like surface antigen